MAYSITRNDYFDLEQPQKSEELYNVIEVPTSPFIENEDDEDVFTSEDDVSIEAGETKEMICEFNSIPVIDVVITIVPSSGDITVDEVNTKIFAWGAKVIVINAGLAGTFTIEIAGKPLNVIGEETVIAESTSSIAESGRLKYEMKGNHLIQDRALAQYIVDGLLASYSVSRKDCTLNWRGNPALELNDEIEPVIYQDDLITTTDTFKIYKQKFDFDGTLRASTEGRKVAA
jgi:hypothetical protein